MKREGRMASYYSPRSLVGTPKKMKRKTKTNLSYWQKVGNWLKNTHIIQIR